MGLTNEILPEIHICYKFNERVCNMIKACKFKEIKRLKDGRYEGLRKKKQFY